MKTKMALWALLLASISLPSFAKLDSAIKSEAAKRYQKLIEEASTYQKGMESEGSFEDRQEEQADQWRKYKKAREEYLQVIKEHQKAYDKAVSENQAIEARIQSLNAQVSFTTDNLNAYVKSAEGLGKDVTSKTLFPDQDQKKYRRLRDEMRKAEEALTEAREKIKEGEEEARENLAIVKENTRLKEAASQKIDSYAKSFNKIKTQKQAAEDAAAVSAAHQLFAEMQGDTYEANLLFARWDALRKDNNISNGQLTALQNQVNDHIRHTFMGRFVETIANEKIRAAMEKENLCKHVNKCEVNAGQDSKKVSDLERQVEALTKTVGAAKEDKEGSDGKAK